MNRGRLSRKREQAIAALLTTNTQQEAADVTGVNLRTLQNWLKEPSFKEAYQAARQQVLSDSIKALQSVSLEAVETLHHSLLNAKTDQARIRAAKLILEYSLKGFLLEDVTSRIAELEKLNNENIRKY